MKTVATIEARMTSTRLPGKVLKESCGLPMLGHLVQRLKKVNLVDEIVLATTRNSTDNILEEFAKNYNINCYRGSEDNVMERVLEAGQFSKADILVEITGDCPLIDPIIIEQTINVFNANNTDYVSNNNVRSYPDGMDTQVYALETLRKSASMTNNKLDQEHVTLHIRNNPDIFSRINLIAPNDLFWPELGLTLDEEDDFILLDKIIKALYHLDPCFSCNRIIKYLKEHPEIVKLNQHVIRKGDT